MLELPESHVIATQLNLTVVGRKIIKVIANSSPHGFAFYNGDPNLYAELLTGKSINRATALAGMIEIAVDDTRLLLGDGVHIRYLTSKAAVPAKHQLLLELDDHSLVVCSVQMYGGIWAYMDGEFDNKYVQAAKDKPSPLSDAFTESYFYQLIAEAKSTISVKALLATEQRIPGLGNGSLQDILFHAKLHPKRKVSVLSKEDKYRIYTSVKTILNQMTEQGGRNTEKDLYGNSGGYMTILSNRTLKDPCPQCGGTLIRQAYMGGNVYYCSTCQPL